MSRIDAVIIVNVLAVSFVTVVVGGLFYPNTIAGSIARFVFSLHI